MEEGETATQLSRKELRKQKLMEYLAAKGRTKLPNLKPYLRAESQVKKPGEYVAKIAPGKENKCLAETRKYQDQCQVPKPVGKATTQPARRAFGVANSAGQAQPNATWRSASSISSESRNIRKAAPAAVSSKLNLNSRLTGQTFRPADKGTKTLSRNSSMAPSHNRAGRSLNASGPVPANAVGARLSLGPLVKTKTGLVPTVPLPRNTKLHSSHISASSADTTTSSNSVARTVHQAAPSGAKPATLLRKTLTTTAPNNLVHKKTALSTASVTQSKIQAPKKTNAKPPMGKQTDQKPGGLKPLPTFRCKAAPAKPVGRDETSKTHKTAPERRDGFTKHKPEPEIRPKMVGPASKSSLGAAGRATLSVARSTQSKERCRSASATLQQTATNAKCVPAKGRPRLSQPVSTAGTAGLQKLSARAIPQTDVKQLTAAQEERMKKLQEWREARGISYKRPPMPAKPQVRRSEVVPHPFWTSMKEEDDARAFICAVDRSLADCIKLLSEGCSADQVKGVLSRLPAVAHKFAKYWICRVRAMEREGDLDVLPVFEEAVGVVLEPVDELRTVVFEILKKRDDVHASEEKEDGIPSPETDPVPMATPKRVRMLICGEKGNSSEVKYRITATPGGPPSQKREPVRFNGQEVRFFTPVRRSVRIERASLQYPASLQDHDVCVASYNELVHKEEEEEEEKKSGGQDDGRTSPSVTSDPTIYIYRENEALNDKVSVRLVYDDGV